MDINTKNEPLEVFQEACMIATEIEESVSTSFNEFDYVKILEVSIFTADKIRSVINMYTGRLNPKWALYDTVYGILKDRLRRYIKENYPSLFWRKDDE